MCIDTSQILQSFALGVSWQHLNNQNLFACIVYRFDVYFHVRIMLHHLGISLPNNDGFSKVAFLR